MEVINIKKTLLAYKKNNKKATFGQKSGVIKSVTHRHALRKTAEYFSNTETTTH